VRASTFLDSLVNSNTSKEKHFFVVVDHFDVRFSPKTNVVSDW
jgi:hypothetical protein